MKHIELAAYDEDLLLHGSVEDFVARGRRDTGIKEVPTSGGFD